MLRTIAGSDRGLYCSYSHIIDMKSSDIQFNKACINNSVNGFISPCIIH